MDSHRNPVYGHPEQSAYNGNFGSTCYRPLLLFNDKHAVLLPANANPERKITELLKRPVGGPSDKPVKRSAICGCGWRCPGRSANGR